MRRLQPIGDFVHTITATYGKEFAAHQDIAHALKTEIFMSAHAVSRMGARFKENTGSPCDATLRRAPRWSSGPDPRDRSGQCMLFASSASCSYENKR